MQDYVSHLTKIKVNLIKLLNFVSAHKQPGNIYTLFKSEKEA